MFADVTGLFTLWGYSVGTYGPRHMRTHFRIRIRYKPENVLVFYSYKFDTSDLSFELHAGFAPRRGAGILAPFCILMCTRICSILVIYNICFLHASHTC